MRRPKFHTSQRRQEPSDGDTLVNHLWQQFISPGTLNGDAVMHPPSLFCSSRHHQPRSLYQQRAWCIVNCKTRPHDALSTKIHLTPTRGWRTPRWWSTPWIWWWWTPTPPRRRMRRTMTSHPWILKFRTPCASLP